MAQTSRKQLNKQFNKQLTSEIMNPKKQINLFDVNLILSFHKELGPEGFKSMISDNYIVSTQEGCDLIEKLISK
jgi:hypothetical protein